MHRGLQLVLLLTFAASVCRAGDRIDGIVATVNNVAILQSDVDEAVRYEALLNGRALNQITAEDSRLALERLIDQELLREQMGTTSVHAGADDVDNRLRDLRAQIPGAQSDDGWRQTLARYGLAEAQVSEHLTEQIKIMRFVDARLQAELRIDRAGVEKYYQETLLPELQKSGAPSVPLADVYSRIEEVLRQQKLDDMLSAWLRDLRQRSRIHYSSEPPGRKDTSATAR